MKIRLDFVTNSSSSSFICDICDRTESGFNISSFELGIGECHNNHWICFDCIEKEYSSEFIKQEIARELNLSEEFKRKLDNLESFDDILSTLYENDLYLEYIPNSICPVCNFKEIATYDLEGYKTYLLGKSNDKLREEIKNRFKNYNEFKDIFKIPIPIKT